MATQDIYQMGTVQIGNNPLPQATKTDLNTFNQSLVKPTTPSTTPGTLTSVTSNNFLNTPTNTPSPSGIVSNYNMAGKVNDITNQYKNLTGQITPAQNQVNQQATPTQPVIDYNNAPYTTDEVGNKKYFNQQTGEYDTYAPDTALGLTQGDAASQFIIKNIQAAQQKNDQALAASLKGISDRFTQYRETQKQITGGAAAGAQNALLQSGAGGRGSVAQYAAATADARVTDIMQQGQRNLQELDTQEQQLIAAAHQAHDTQDYKLLGEINNQIETTRQEKLASSQALAKQLAVETQKAEIDTAVADIYSQGTTDIPSILNQLKAKGITASASTIQETIKNITPSGLDDLVKTMRQNNAPGDMIQKVIDTGIKKGVGSAYTEAGQYGAGGTGIIGEYNYYVAQAQAQGIKPVDFTTYQTQDANRKAVATTPAGLTTNQNQSFLRITDKFQADPFINNALKGQTAKSIADQVLADPNNAANQLKSLYVLVKNLDPDSAVREGEISLAQQTLSYADRFKTYFDRINNGQVIAPSAAKELALATKDLAKAWTDTAAKRQKQYEAQAAGAGIDDAFKSYLQSSGVNSFINTSDTLLKGQAKNQQAFTKLIEGNKNDPAVSQEISNRIQDLIDTLGHEPTADEYFEAYPYDMPKEMSMGPNGGGIVEGVDITSYAADPKHEQKIATIVEKAPITENVLDYDKYIKSIAPTSPITGDMILTASSTHGVDPRLVLAIIQNDSSFGTKGHGARNNNPGNIGQFDNLKSTVKGYPTLAAGVEAVAKWLANHKVNNIA